MGADSQLQEGQRFAGCIVAREIGRGAHSVVHAAFDEAAQEWRALKLLLPAGGSDPQPPDPGADPLQRELAAAAHLHHPGIVRLHRHGVSRGRPWLLMELLPGTDLGRYTQPARRLPVPVVAAIGARLADALACAHAAGIVHRDLKPANVMLDWASDRVVITDFGLARADDAERTRTGLVLGSPAYMAPELLAGQAPTPASDLYALGVLLFQLLACRLPFEADGLGALLREVAGAPPPDLLKLVPPPPDPALPPLALVVRLLLAKQPAERPADAARAALLLRQAGDVQAGPPAAPSGDRQGPLSRG
jgi:serine/threonine-protein kinase